MLDSACVIGGRPQIAVWNTERVFVFIQQANLSEALLVWLSLAYKYLNCQLCGTFKCGGLAKVDACPSASEVHYSKLLQRSTIIDSTSTHDIFGVFQNACKQLPFFFFFLQNLQLTLTFLPALVQAAVFCLRILMSGLQAVLRYGSFCASFHSSYQNHAYKLCQESVEGKDTNS